MARRKAKILDARKAEHYLDPALQAAAERVLILFILVFRGFDDRPCAVCIGVIRMIRSFKGMNPTIPASCYVDESAQIIGDVVLGEHASVWMNAVVRGDVYAIRIGANSNIQDCSVLHGMKNSYGVTVGEYVTVGHSVTLHGCVDRRPLSDRHGLDHFEWREDRRGIDYRRRHADSRAHRRRAGLAMDGITRKIPSQAGEE